MSIILASRGMFGQATHELIQSLPLVVSSIVTMSVSQKRQSTDINSIERFTSLLESEDIYSEEMMKKGNLVNEVSNTAVSRNVDIIILAEGPARPGNSRILASDGLAVLKKSGKPVILQPRRCIIRNTGNILVAMSGIHQSPKSRWNLENILHLAGREVVVLSVSSPYFPVFSEVGAGLRSHQPEAAEDIWAGQASEASMPAALIAGRLKEAGAKSWFISRTGRFVNEVQKTAKSADISFVCILIDQTVRRRWLGKAELMEIFETISVPVMLIPCEC